jgi:NADH-quinone oxidoreductase subunit L
MLFATSVALLVIVASYFVYAVRRSVPASDEAQTSFEKVLANKFYIDELYNFLFVRPIEALSRLFYYYFDVWGIDGLVNGVANSVHSIGGFFRRLQNGNIEYYLIGMVAGALLLFLTLFI